MLSFVILAVLLLQLTSGCCVFVIACVRRKELPWLVQKELEKTSVGEYYPYIAAADRWLKEHRPTDVYTESKDHLQLHALWIPAENAIGTVLFAHGYRSTYLLDFGAAFSLYHERGFNLLIPDQRAHGKSEGRYITFGVNESEDMYGWIAYHNRHLSEKPVILSGISMGAATMLYLADRKLPDNVRGIIADCGFTSPNEIISSVFRRVIHLPPAPSVPVADLIARLVSGFSFYEKDTLQTVKQAQIPILFIHGKDDGFVPCEMTEQAYAVCSGPKQILLVDGADHGLSFVVEPDRYLLEVDHFLNRCLYTDKGEAI